jgi:LacI family transcriptional regulator
MNEKVGGTGRAGIKEVAKLAGVGIASVSRVLSGQPGSSPDLTQRVLAAARQLGYTPNLMARGLRRRTSRSIGFVNTDITNPLLASIVSGAESVMSSAGYSILLTNSGGVPEVDGERIDALIQRQVDGLILLPATENDPAMLGALRGTDIPIVVIDRTLPADIGAHYVLSDHYAGVGEAARHLLSAGHRRIALIVGRDVRPSRERIRAVEDAYASLALKRELVIDQGTLTVEHGDEALDRLLRLKRPPTAVILGGNQLLEGALRAIRRHEMRLGVDLALACCDEVPLSRLYDPPIATVMRDTALLGQRAAELLLRQINDARESECIVLPTWFEPRASAGADHGNP